MTEDFVPLAHSRRVPLEGAHAVADTPGDQSVHVTVYVRPKSAGADDEDPTAEALKLPRDRTYTSEDEIAGAFGADPADLDAVAAFAREHGLTADKRDIAARSIRLVGTAAQMSDAFHVSLKQFKHDGGDYRGREGDIEIPASLEPIIEAVLGLDNRRIGRAYMKRSAGAPTFEDVRAATSLHLPPNTYLPPTVGALYGFPQHADGTGQTVGVLAFNGQIGATGQTAPGGYDASLLEAYFTKILGRPAPQITDVVVHGPGNSPGDGSDPNDASGEVYLDLCIVGALAPGAKIVVYFTEFTERGWVDAISRAVTDTVNKPSVISISYGNPENDPHRSLWTTMAVNQVNRAFKLAAAAGRTITCAAGDDGSADEPGTNVVHADFPASSPWVLGCGGTRLTTAHGKISAETVWGDLADGHGATGGGVSRTFGVPSWQNAAAVQSATHNAPSGRGVPDVASLADPETPFVVVTPDGKLGGVGGTSAAAPLWAALVARLDEALDARVGYLNPLLYTRYSSGVLRDITQGDNGAYEAGEGWDACTGLGSPGATELLEALSH